MYYFTVLDPFDNVIMTTDDLDLACGKAITADLPGVPTVAIFRSNDGGPDICVDMLRHSRGCWYSDQEGIIYGSGRETESRYQAV